MSRYFSGYDRFGTFNLFTDSGDVGAELERLLYTYARNLLGRHRPSIELLYFLFDLVRESMRKRIADILDELTTNYIQPDSFRDASSLAQLVTTVAAENPKTDHRVTDALKEYIDEFHQSSKLDDHLDKPLTEAARALQRLFRLTDAELEVLLFLYTVSRFEAFETVWTSHRAHGRSKLIAVATSIDESSVAEALSAGSRMMLTGLLQITGGQNSLLVSLSSDVVAAISHQAPGSMKSNYLIEMNPSSVDLDSFTVPEAARRLIQSLIESPEQHHILVVGQPGVGKTELIRCIARSFGKTPLLYRLQSDSTAAVELRRITASSCLIDTDREILILDECDHILNSRAVFAGSADAVTKGKINALLDGAECSTIWTVHDADYMDASVRRRFRNILDYPRPTLRQRA